MFMSLAYNSSFLYFSCQILGSMLCWLQYELGVILYFQFSEKLCIRLGFLEYMVEPTCETIWDWCSFCGEILNFWFNFLNKTFQFSISFLSVFVILCSITFLFSLLYFMSSFQNIYVGKEEQCELANSVS